VLSFSAGYFGLHGQGAPGGQVGTFRERRSAHLAWLRASTTAVASGVVARPIKGRVAGHRRTRRALRGAIMMAGVRLGQVPLGNRLPHLPGSFRCQIAQTVGFIARELICPAIVSVTDQPRRPPRHSQHEGLKRSCRCRHYQGKHHLPAHPGRRRCSSSSSA